MLLFIDENVVFRSLNIYLYLYIESKKKKDEV
jgi:hypothetical protein